MPERLVLQRMCVDRPHTWSAGHQIRMILYLISLMRWAIRAASIDAVFVIAASPFMI